MKRTALAVFISCVILFVIVGTSHATDGTIYGCVLKHIGSLRIVSSPSNCTKFENPIELASPAPPTGINKGLHGTVGGGTGTIISGEGFSFTRLDTGRYEITFDSPFTELPDCVVTTRFAEELYVCGYGVYTNKLLLFCGEATIFYPYTPNEFVYSTFADVQFTFICVQ